MGEEGFKLELPKVGIIKGVQPKDIEVVGEKIVNVRVRAKPYSNTYTPEQLEKVAEVADKYGSGKVHLSPRHNLEIPEIKNSMLMQTLQELFSAGLQAGGSGTSVRNIFTCADYCPSRVRGVRELGAIVSELFGDMPLPNKFTISFAACPAGCSRPYHVDIGIIGVAELDVEPEKCRGYCPECVESCPVEGAISIEEGLKIDSDMCVRCGRCARACSRGAIRVKDTGFKVVVGGKEGRTVLFGEEYLSFVKEYEVIEAIDRVIRQYKKLARKRDRKKYERLGEVIQRIGGIEDFMQR